MKKFPIIIGQALIHIILKMQEIVFIVQVHLIQQLVYVAQAFAIRQEKHLQEGPIFMDWIKIPVNYVVEFMKHTTQKTAVQVFVRKFQNNFLFEVLLIHHKKIPLRLKGGFLIRSVVYSLSAWSTNIKTSFGFLTVRNWAQMSSLRNNLEIRANAFK